MLLSALCSLSIVSTIKKKRQGMFKMGQDDIRIRLSVDEKTITYTMCEGGKMKEIFLEDVLGCEKKRGTSNTFCIFARNKDLLLEGESSDEEYCEAFVSAISFLCKNRSDGKEGSGGEGGKKSGGSGGNSLSDAANTQIRFAKRELELMGKKKDAAKRKEKYMKDVGGLKYTAIAMANMK
jgi:hypothetical protein